MKALIFFITVALLVATPAFAAAATDFTVSIDTPDSYLVGTTGTAVMHIYNNGTSGSFGVIYLGMENWIWTNVSHIVIASGETKDVTFYISPPLSADPKIYSTILTITRESNGAKIDQQLLVQVAQTVDASLSNFTTSCTECGGSADFSVDVRNVGTEPFIGTLTADVTGIPRIFQLEIARGEVQHIEDSLDLSGFRPGDYTIKLDLNSTTRHIQTLSKDFTITTVQNVIYNSSSSSSPFGNFVTLTASNMGNVPMTATLRAPILKTWWSVYSGPVPTTVTDTEYFWTMELAGGGHVEIAYSEIFWPLPIIIIALAIIGIFAYIQFAALTVSKAAVGRTMIIPGKDIGIAITIKNARAKAESIIVREMVPSAFSVSGRFDTVKPTMRKLHTGTELVWKFSNVGPGEERIIHYKITPNVQIYGGTVLTPTIVRARTGIRTIERMSKSIFLQGATSGTRKLPIEVEK